MIIKNKKALYAAIVLSTSFAANAASEQDVDKAITDINKTQVAILSNTLKSANTQSMMANAEAMGLTKVEAVQAAAWNLTLEDWVKYKALMKLTPRGIWSKDIDPITALGVEATTEEERKRYATISLQLEAQRVEKELAFERTRQRVAKDMFAGKHIIAPIIKDAEPQLTSVVALFSSTNCNQECIEYMKDSLRTSSSNTKVDIYVVGASSDEDIYKLSNEIGLDTELVNSGKVTLNYDSGKFMKLGLKELPAKITVGQDGKIQNASYPYISKK